MKKYLLIVSGLYPVSFHTLKECKEYLRGLNKMSGRKNIALYCEYEEIESICNRMFHRLIIK